MSSFNASISPEFIARAIAGAISNELEQLVRARLQDEIDPILSELAREIAANTMVNAAGYLESVSRENFGGPAIIINLSFNNENVTYIPEPKS